MKLSSFLLFSFSVLSCLFMSCGVPAALSGSKSLHDVYGDKIRSAGLEATQLGRLWLAAAEESITTPLPIRLPYSEKGYFEANEPKAAGYIFEVKRGQKLIIEVSKKPLLGFAVYVDLFSKGEPGKTPKFLVAADSVPNILEYEIEKAGNYILRLQPELLKGGEYALTISTRASLAFPVSARVKSNIGSFWGAGRDGGKRRHEGIDIFAPRGSALLAAAKGTITNAGENHLGGKVIFLAPDQKDYVLYYAHLDSQLVQQGQTVNVGDTIGLVGNTGNARTTAPHLHFGIYARGGAIDPLPFINNVNVPIPKVTVSADRLNRLVKNNKKLRLTNAPGALAEVAIEANTLLKIEAATTHEYRVVLPNGQKGFITFSDVVDVNNPKKVSLKSQVAILDSPDEPAAIKRTVSAGETLSIHAGYNNFYYVSNAQVYGWVSKSML